MPTKRNTIIAIAKGIAIILVVAGHAEGPEWLTNFIYEFHMPLFFMAAGFFFSRKYLSDPWPFIARRFKGLYLPFLKWSVLFLLLHNVWFHIGVLNETYGNWTGGVTHPYTLKQGVGRLLTIVTQMAGYDEFIAGAFWFFRGLLVASIVFLLLYKLVDSHTRLKPMAGVGAVCLLILAILAIRINFHLKINALAGGGWRDMWGVFFFGAGYLFRQFGQQAGRRRWVALLCMMFLSWGATQHFCGMYNGGKFLDLLTLPLTGIGGFLLVYYISSRIDSREGHLRDALIYLGENTLYIFILHILAYKPVSLLKIAWYGLDPQQVGCHMVIHDMRPDWFWIPYTIAGVLLPVGALELARLMRRSGKRIHQRIRDKRNEAGADAEAYESGSIGFHVGEKTLD